jgi:hypothetical protein
LVLTLGFVRQRASTRGSCVTEPEPERRGDLNGA